MSLWEKTVEVSIYFIVAGFDIALIITLIGCIFFTIKYIRKKRKRYIPFIWLSVIYVLPRMTLFFFFLIYLIMYIWFKIEV